MQVREKKFTVKSIIENTENGNITYDHPMQRKPGQWDNEQQSLLIHSILAGYAVPQAYGLQLFDNYDEAFSVLDGKQRFTTVCDFVHDKFALMDETPSVIIRRRHLITDENGKKHSEFIGCEYDISNKKFSELDDKLQDKIKDLSVYLYNDQVAGADSESLRAALSGTPLFLSIFGGIQAFPWLKKNFRHPFEAIKNQKAAFLTNPANKRYDLVGNAKNVLIEQKNKLLENEIVLSKV